MALKNDKLLNLLLHPAVLAIPIFLAILLFSDLSIAPYHLTIENIKLNSDTRETVLYDDINSDSTQERIRTYDLKTNATVFTTTENNTVYEAWNLQGYWYEKPDFILHDYDGDGIKEMFAMTVRSGDSLYVNRLALKKGQIDRESKFVSRMGRFNGVLDQVIFLHGFSDMSGDGIEDFIFCVAAGFTLQPRAFYGWDLVHDTLFRSPEAGIKYNQSYRMVHPGKSPPDRPLLFVLNSATDNYKYPYPHPYPDTASYAVVFTSDFEYLFEPKYLGGGPQSKTLTYPMSAADEINIFALTFDRRKSSNRTALNLMDQTGTVLESAITDIFDQGSNNIIFNQIPHFFAFNNGSTRIGTIDQKLDFNEKADISGSFHPVLSINLDQDDDEELILLHWNSQEIGILQDNYRDFVRVNTPPFGPTKSQISVIHISPRNSSIFVHSESHNYQLLYEKNRFYALRFFLYLLIYGLICGLLYLFRRIFTYTNSRRMERERLLLDYQLQTIMNQLNPHFTFNAINSIGDAVLEGRNQEAYTYFTKLSALIRKSTTHALEPYKTLGEEIQFVREYLEIEKYRFGNKLNWTMEVDPGLDLSIKVPKMLIHIFVENTLKHGIFHLKKEGQVDILAMNKEDHTEISITDNGVGFSSAFKIERTKGRGLSILDKYLEIYNSSQNHQISYQISDLSDTEMPGTRVVIQIK